MNEDRVRAVLSLHREALNVPRFLELFHEIATGAVRDVEKAGKNAGARAPHSCGRIGARQNRRIKKAFQGSHIAVGNMLEEPAAQRNKSGRADDGHLG